MKKVGMKVALQISIGKERDDISFLRNLPGMTVISVVDPIEAEKSGINISTIGYF